MWAYSKMFLVVLIQVILKNVLITKQRKVLYVKTVSEININSRKTHLPPNY